MAVFDILNAAFSSKSNNPSSVSGTDYFAAVAASGSEKSAKAGGKDATPSFGIKGKAPLTKDVFEYKGQKLSLEDAQKKSYADVYRHESAHLAKAGKYATSGIHIDFDGKGIAVSGHVDIAMPTLNKKNPKETIEHAEAVIASAEAPAGFDELSDADKNVAAQARAIKSQAQSLNVMA